MVNDFNQLFYQDSYQKSFDTGILSAEKYKNKNWLTFEKTCFYPLGGGQPGDQGFIQIIEEVDQNHQNGFVSEHKIKVLDTIWHDGVIWHQVSQLLPIGSRIHGEIDFNRRYDLMQQHSGEHIISGIVNRKYGYKNVGFHINEEETTFDFDGDLSWEEIENLEIEANQAVLENIPIEIYYLNKEEQKKWNFRSKIALDDQVRVVYIPNYDSCACAGTHVHSTAEIGLIKIINRESYKGGVRLTVLCGGRSLKYYQKLQTVLRDSTSLLSANLDTLLMSIERKDEEINNLKEEIHQKNNAMIDLIIENQILNSDNKNIILENNIFNKKELNYVVSQMAKKIDGFVALLTKQGEKKYSLYLYSEHHQLKDNISLLEKNLNFKGGGNKNLLQGRVCGKFKDIKTILSEII